jgi:hypothetical protein
LAILVGVLAFAGATLLAIRLSTVGGVAGSLAIPVVGGAWGVFFGFLMDQVCIPLTRRYLRQAREAGRCGRGSADE